ncbi:class I SAM-dependent methyltransferase [bacterium]|nr:MAG: class I SAM-dependent methyltransferase [bacterium]
MEMTLAYRSEEKNLLVQALLAELRLAAVDLSIDIRDEMLGFLLQAWEGDRDQALFQYFRSGASIAGVMGQALRWRFGDPGRVDGLLDFASGYGRVTRFLIGDVPPERVWVSDVYAEGVRFQGERFGVHGLVSTVRPEDFRCERRFDAILVTSLFTHLPEERFVAWLRVLMGLLTPRGVLAFSTHSPAVLPHGVEMPPAGIVFEERSESGSLDTSDYGSTWVTEAFVREALGRAVGAASLHRIDRGLCNFQDLYLAVPEPDADFSGLGFEHEPYLFVEVCALQEEGRRLALEGWTASLSSTPREVQAVLDGELMATAPVAGPRADVAASLGDERYLHSGWGCSFPLPEGASRSSSVLLLRVVDGRGVAHPLQASTIDAALLGTARLEAERLAAELARAEARALREIAALRDRIHAMEASRFWKTRNAWFSVKRRLGLTDET